MLIFCVTQDSTEKLKTASPKPVERQSSSPSFQFNKQSNNRRKNSKILQQLRENGKLSKSASNVSTSGSDKKKSSSFSSSQFTTPPKQQVKKNKSRSYSQNGTHSVQKNSLSNSNPTCISTSSNSMPRSPLCKEITPNTQIPPIELPPPATTEFSYEHRNSSPNNNEEKTDSCTEETSALNPKPNDCDITMDKSANSDQLLTGKDDTSLENHNTKIHPLPKLLLLICIVAAVLAVYLFAI